MIRYKPNKTLIPRTPNDFTDRNFQWELDPTVITWDGGNGTSSCWHLVDGALHYFMLPNVRVPVTVCRPRTSSPHQASDIGSTPIAK